MKTPASVYVLGLTAVCSELINAFKLQVTGRLNDEHALRRRGNLEGSSPLQNSADISYYANVSMGGTQFSVLIDTGSADLWVAGAVPNARDSGKKSGVTYAIGEVKGPVKFAELEFAGFKITDQAYLEVTPNKENKEGKGLIGLGPVSGSNVFNALEGASTGAPVLDRIFLQNLTTPNYLTVNLGRTEDPTDIFGGDMSIGEVLEGLGDIEKQSKLPVSIVPVRKAGDQHFQVLIDADGVIGPDGKPVSVHSEVDGAKNPKQLTAVVDTGFSLTQVPKSFADGIYSRFDGAEFVNVTGIGPVWIVPCDQEVNITMKFAGQSFPIHPMDSTLNPTIVGLSGVDNSRGERSCLGTFQPMSFDRGSSVTYDVILGMSFIRNTYALFNFGDFITGPEDRGDPYIQFLSTTDPAEAHSDFVTVRLNGKDTTGDQKLGDAKQSNTPVKTTGFQTRTIYLILGIAAIVLALIVIFGSILLLRRRRRSAGAYKPLHDPAPMKMGAIPAPTAPYNPTYAQPYNQPYPTQPLYDPPTYTGTHTHYPSPWDQRPHH